MTATVGKAPKCRISLAAGQGFEPQLPDPESGVLPLDDPAPFAGQCSERIPRLEVDAVQLDEPGVRLRVDVRDDLDVRLEPRSAELGLEQAVHLEDPGGVVHPDLDQDRL